LSDDFDHHGGRWSAAVELKSLTYISLARPSLGESDIAAIHHISLDLNALDEILGC
jgi:hypothetical protein